MSEATFGGVGTRVVAPGPTPMRPVLLLRHAWAGERGDVASDDRRRPLDARGRAQAARLPEQFRDLLGDQLPTARLLSSPLSRCVQTLEPLAATLGAAIDLDERLAEVRVPLHSHDGWPDAAWYGGRALAAVTDAGGSGTLLIVCSHGEILPALLALLAGRDGRDVPMTSDLSCKALDKGGAWLLPAGPAETVVEVAAPGTSG
jgi:broad specificity phosphatase PhoE